MYSSMYYSKKSKSCKEENVINNGSRKEKSVCSVTEIPTDVRQDEYEDQMGNNCNINMSVDSNNNPR